MIKSNKYIEVVSILAEKSVNALRTFPLHINKQDNQIKYYTNKWLFDCFKQSNQILYTDIIVEYFSKVQ